MTQPVYLLPVRRNKMTTLQAIGLGAMLVWTPSLIVLAASLWDIPEEME